MTTTKPPRIRIPAALRPRRAPLYARLTVEAYAALDPDEQARHDAHIDVDAAFDARPFAELDRRSHGFPGSTRPQEGARSTDEGALNAVEAASLRPEPASEWLAEFAEMRALVIRVARLARYHWGFDPERSAGPPGSAERVNAVELCAWCGEPAPGGRDANGRPLVHRVDGMAVHAATCYHQACRRARTVAVSLGATIRAGKDAPA